MRSIVLAMCCLAPGGCMLISVDVDDSADWRPGGYSRGSLAETYEGIARVQVNTVRGDVQVHGTDAPHVEAAVVFDVRPARTMRPQFRKEGTVLMLSEHWSEPLGKGSVRWTVQVPRSCNVEFFSAAGDLTVDGVHGTVLARTDTGDVVLRRCSGAVDAETHSGNIHTQHCSGSVRAVSLKGRVRQSE